MGPEHTELALVATAWGVGVLLLAAGATIASRTVARVSAFAFGATLIVSVAAYALLPLR